MSAACRRGGNDSPKRKDHWSDFERGERGCWCFTTCWSAGIFMKTISGVFTGDGPRKKKQHPVKGVCLVSSSEISHNPRLPTFDWHTTTQTEWESLKSAVWSLKPNLIFNAPWIKRHLISGSIIIINNKRIRKQSSRSDVLLCVCFVSEVPHLEETGG